VPEPATYAAAGVNLDAADDVVARIAPHARSTFRSEVVGDIGGFGGVVRVPEGLRDPVLVSSTDGVGTKLDIAEAAGRFDTIGIDLVAMCADDVAVQGADPLFFLDYIAVGHLAPDVVEQIVSGVAEGCRQAGCALVGGEVAEHGEGHGLELAGFCVGVAERSSLLTGATVRPGHMIIGLASPGLRSNGYSLARHVLLDLAALPLENVADELLRPSVVYSPVMSAMRAQAPVHAFAHITGGGLPGNVIRVLPEGSRAVLHRRSWPVPEIFSTIQRLGAVTDDEMARVFNLGVGMVAIVDRDAVDAAVAAAPEAYVIGVVEAGERGVELR
jgi:phosphoribosylformylglycinamidine cyclo-ligase